MIVKNEAHIIQRCLDSVRPFIDHWLIVDTGSTDGTQQLIRQHLRDLPGELFERPWKNFGHNRTEALELARGRADYLFVIDADEVLQLPADYRRPPLQAEAYALDVHFGGINYGRVCLLQVVGAPGGQQQIDLRRRIVRTDAADDALADLKTWEGRLDRHMTKVGARRTITRSRSFASRSRRRYSRRSNRPVAR